MLGAQAVGIGILHGTDDRGNAYFLQILEAEELAALGGRVGEGGQSSVPQVGLLGLLQTKFGKEGGEGGVDISGVALTAIAFRKGAHGGAVGIPQGLPKFLRVGQHGLHGAGGEGLALDHGIAELGGEGVGHGVAVLLFDGVEQRLGGLTASGLACEEGAYLAHVFETVVSDNDILIVAGGVSGKLLEIGNIEILYGDRHGSLLG